MRLFSLLILMTVSFGGLCQVSPPGPYSGHMSVSYIREWDAKGPDTSAADLVNEDINTVTRTTQYFDGFGRPVQKVAWQQTQNGNDLVTANIYDPFGRESYKYLPFASNVASAGDTSNNGNFKFDPFQQQAAFNAVQYPSDNFYYAQTNYEASPLNRVNAAYSAGNSWIGSGRGINSSYVTNAISDSVMMWNIQSASGSLPFNTGKYAAGSLYKTIIMDEQGSQVISYKDKSGYVVLKKVQSSVTLGTGHVGWLNTYYVYDSLENLRFVITPQAVNLINTGSSWTITSAIANELCYRYEYDYRNRAIIKKLPGAGEVWMVYDIRDRIVMTQDSLLRSQRQWLFTRYDSLNRMDSSGLLTDSVHYNNLSYHANLAATSNNYPNPASYTSQVLTINFYDNYSWVVGTGSPIGSSMATNYLGSSSPYFSSTLNSSPQYAVGINAVNLTQGTLTGKAVRVLGTGSQFLYSVSFFDDHNRVIQMQETNYTGGIDTLTTQYNFSSKPIATLLSHKKSGNTSQYHNVLNLFYYDAMLRPFSTWQMIDNSGAPAQLLNYFSYDELSQPSLKYIGTTQSHSGGSVLDSMIYTYNIRGWLTSINPSFLTKTPSTHFFGMELAYDDSSSVTGTTSYKNPVYNDNIAGLSWKSEGDQVIRKYDFTYDPAGRLTSGTYQDNKNGSWGTAATDYSVGGLSYDANGNILTMRQNGYTLNSPGGIIDQLGYSYQPGSNKLAQVVDTANNVNSTLGDFHYNPTAKQSADYNYDGNGNLVLDNNKGISSISYNYLNQPQQVNFTGKGNIVYVYDATGNKLKKVVTDTVLRHTTSTLYIGPYVYQQSDTITNPNGGMDTLQYMTHDEGRARWAFHKYLNGFIAYGWEYDFFEKDHLGNTRVVLTQQADSAKYKATMEAAYRTTENALFYNIPGACVARNTVMGYPSPDGSAIGTNPNDSLCRTNGNGPKQGTAIILKVMAGDKVDVAVNYYYNNVGVTSGQRLSPGDLINSLATGIVGVTGGMHGSSTDLTGSATPLTGALTSFLNSNNDTTPGKPSAYLNWVLFDNQFTYVSASSGAIQVGAAGSNGGVLQPPLAQIGIDMKKSGYLYIYVSNATPGWDVYFDNLTVMTYSGPMLEETHYYPFGLTMAGISDKALKYGYSQNKHLYNGKEIQNKEFGDGSGFEEYDYGARMLDPQLGRWWTLDSKAELMRRYSPYNFAFNNPLRFIDPDGMGPEDVTPKDAKAMQAILNTLPKADRAFVKVGSDGKIDRKLFDSHSSTSSNYNSLKVLVDDKKVTTISVTDQYLYKDKSGDIKTDHMGPITHDFAEKPGNTGESGELGVTLLPDKSVPKQSTDNNINIVINNGLSDLGQAETLAHEAYGHDFLFLKGLPPGHKYITTGAGFKETNIPLGNAIKSATIEAEKNYHDK